MNSTNSSISLDSALASKVIAMKAGPGLQAECAAHVSNAGTLLAGGIFTSSGYNLSCQFVVHVYCPNNPQVQTIPFKEGSKSLAVVFAGTVKGSGRLPE